MLAVGADGGCLDIFFSHIYHSSFLSPSVDVSLVYQIIVPNVTVLMTCLLTVGESKRTIAFSFFLFLSGELAINTKVFLREFMHDSPAFPADPRKLHSEFTSV